MRADMVRAYVESLLERLTGSEKVLPDDDGDYPVRYRKALYYVRLVGSEDPVVQVFAVAVADVPATPELFEELNTINRDIRFARTFWVRGQVLVEADLVGEGIDPPHFDNACGAVASITDHYGALLAAQFGGTTAFMDEKNDDERGDDPTSLTGQYL